jgi:hypothetical protein
VRTQFGWIVLLTALSGAAVSGTVDAQVLDRLKRKLNEAKSEVQDARNDVDAVTHVDERVEAAANSAIPTEAQLENRAAAAVEDTAAVQSVREAERDANAVATADERAIAAAQGEVGAAEREVESALDVEGRARGAVDRTEGAAAARELESEVDAALTADERAARELERRRAELERATRLE